MEGQENIKQKKNIKDNKVFSILEEIYSRK